MKCKICKEQKKVSYFPKYWYYICNVCYYDEDKLLDIVRTELIDLKKDMIEEKEIKFFKIWI